MSHKGNSGKGKKSSKSGPESKSEDVLQAVCATQVLADSFQDRFKPFTTEKPRCLLPLANTPLIEYTLEFLAMNGVNEVYIYCGAHTDQVEDYISRSRWSTAARTSPFSHLQFVRVSDARSAGDVLRDLDKRSLVDGDFILVHGDLVSNIMLDSALAAHRKRREDSAANIMTMVLRSGGEDDHRTKTNGITPVFVVDTKTQRCLHYDEMNPLTSDRYMSLDPAVVDELSTEFEIRSDLIDAQIDICTPEVLALWSESFDYELPRRNFLHGVLKDWELNGKMIFTEICEEGYAARASNLQQYDSVSRDVLDRWTYPFIPECNIVPKQSYQRHMHGVVAEHGAFYANDAKISNSIIGRDSNIGSGSNISNSIIGRDCKIGANVVLVDSFIWDDTTIEDGVRIYRSIVADSVTIGKNSSIAEGGLIATGVTVSESTSLPTDTAVSCIDYDGNPLTPDTKLLGPNTNAALFMDPDDEELDERDPSQLQKSLLYNLAQFNISTSSVSTLSSEISEDIPDETSLHVDTDDPSRRTSFVSDDAGDKLSFHNEAVHGLVDALRAESGDFDSAKLEFMGLRLSNDASDAMMRRAVASAFARRAVELMTPEYGSLEPSKAAERALVARQGATKFINEVGIGGEDDNESEQVEFIIALQKALTRAHGPEQSRVGILLAAMLQQLYALDILEEEGILSWWENERAVDGEGMALLKEKCRVLVEWLETAEEEDDSDDE
ncbi:related to GCD6 - translation initiation factor eIF2b epsilon, 81 kDa subunit [Fusarium torulosum]|uniref:Translation initiation factor eIF2B subunit epsilon n=1 Tax=Fusarium torulosum TaxID=33205 RepID=A0AAE8M5L4_9HYPO|nr:related to GCD6 - translation initiation factor eIF2b epsilon, 81 kDa subunit [Fusarium torulosum]